MGLQRGKVNSWLVEKRKCLVNKGCPAVLISLSSEKIISRNSSLPGVGSISNVDFLYKCRFLLQKGISTLFSELLLYLQFLKNNQFKLILMPKRHILG